MEQTRALNALEPFLALSKAASSPRAAANLITQATSHPNTYVFAELLQTPNIQALRSSEEYAAYLTLLEIFSWGTLSDYKANPTLPPLTPKQHQKLLLLSLLPLSTSHTTLTYPSLLTALSLPSTHDLEELITTAIYNNLLTATLDPAHGLVNVTSVSPLRDLSPGSLPALSSTLSTWSTRCTSALLDLEAQMAAVKRDAVQRERERRRKEKAHAAVWAAFEESSKGDSASPASKGPRGMGGGMRGGDEDAMEIDGEGNGINIMGRSLRSAAARGGAGLGFGGRRRG